MNDAASGMGDAPELDASTAGRADAASAPDGRDAQQDQEDAGAGTLDGSFVDAGDADSPTADAAVEAPPPDLPPLLGGDGKVLPFRVVDAEYSTALERIVLVTGEPERLVVLDPEAFTMWTAELPLTPSSVSIAPDGLTAAVGHSGFVSIFSLEPLQRLHNHPVGTDVFDVVLAGNGYVYAFPRRNDWVTLYSVRVDTGAQTTAGQLSGGTTARLHPAGDRMYGADRDLSPDDIERFDLGQGTAAPAYDSPYHGTYPMCGSLWFSRDGARIFTACANVFQASNVQADDMKYVGTLERKPRIRSFDHSPTAKLLATVHGPENYPPRDPLSPPVTDIALFEPASLAFLQSATLPRFKAGAKDHAGEGRFVFFNAQGTRLYVLVQAAAAAPLLNNLGLVRYTLTSDGTGPSVLEVSP